MISRVILRAAVVSAALNFLLPSFGEAATGSLTQLSGAAGCVSDDGTGGACVDGSGLGGAGWVAVSPDGKNVYVAAFTGSALTTFARNASTGGLTQLAGTAGCVVDGGGGVSCAGGRGLTQAVSVVVSPDGKNVYVASRVNAVAAFFPQHDYGGANATKRHCRLHQRYRGYRLYRWQGVGGPSRDRHQSGREECLCRVT